MKEMNDNALFKKLKSAIESLREENHCPQFMLVPLLEEKTTLDAPHERAGWRNREAGMLQVRRSHSWYGEIAVMEYDAIPAEFIDKEHPQPFHSVMDLENNPTFRKYFLKPYQTREPSDSEAVYQTIIQLVKEYWYDGYTGVRFFGDRGPRSSPDRRVTVTLAHHNGQRLVKIAANFIDAEWANPYTVPFRISSGGFHEQLPDFRPISDEDVLSLIAAGFGGATYDSTNEFKDAYMNLHNDGFVAAGYAKTTAHHIVKMWQKGTEQRPIWKYLYHCVK